MKVTLALVSLPLVANAVNVVQSNDDGWAVKNIRVFYNRLVAAGFQSVISAPAENQSGTSSFDLPPSTVDDDGCQFESCPPGSPPTGRNQSMPIFNVRPMTAITLCLVTLLMRHSM
jgi:hypothetical protein